MEIAEFQKLKWGNYGNLHSGYNIQISGKYAMKQNVSEEKVCFIWLRCVEIETAFLFSLFLHCLELPHKIKWGQF